MMDLPNITHICLLKSSSFLFFQKHFLLIQSDRANPPTAMYLGWHEGTWEPRRSAQAVTQAQAHSEVHGTMNRQHYSLYRHLQIAIHNLIPTSISHLLFLHLSSQIWSRSQLWTSLIQPKTISGCLHTTMISTSSSNLLNHCPSLDPDYLFVQNPSHKPTSSILSFVFSNWFILIRATVDSEPIPGTLRTKQE